MPRPKSEIKALRKEEKTIIAELESLARDQTILEAIVERMQKRLVEESRVPDRELRPVTIHRLMDVERKVLRNRDRIWDARRKHFILQRKLKMLRRPEDEDSDDSDEFGEWL